VSRHIAEAIRVLGSDAGKRRITRNLAEESITQVKLGFRQLRNPYGVPWPPLKSRDGQALRQTGRMQNSFTVAVTGDSQFVVGTNAQYAATHQYGATIVPKRAKRLVFAVRGRLVFARKVIIPQRQMMPENDLGPIWSRAFAESTTEVVGDIMKGA
jgi:phage gpG-like protein